jgi:hypothetical protein
MNLYRLLKTDNLLLGQYFKPEIEEIDCFINDNVNIHNFDRIARIVQIKLDRNVIGNSFCNSKDAVTRGLSLELSSLLMKEGLILWKPIDNLSELTSNSLNTVNLVNLEEIDEEFIEVNNDGNLNDK